MHSTETAIPSTYDWIPEEDIRSVRSRKLEKLKDRSAVESLLRPLLKRAAYARILAKSLIADRVRLIATADIAHSFGRRTRCYAAVHGSLRDFANSGQHANSSAPNERRETLVSTLMRDFSYLQKQQRGKHYTD